MISKKWICSHLPARTGFHISYQRLLADAHHFTETLSTLAEVDGPGPGLEVCVNNIKIKDRRTYQPPKPASTPPPKAPPTPSKFGYNFGKWNPGN